MSASTSVRSVMSEQDRRAVGADRHLGRGEAAPGDEALPDEDVEQAPHERALHPEAEGEEDAGVAERHDGGGDERWPAPAPSRRRSARRRPPAAGTARGQDTVNEARAAASGELHAGRPGGATGTRACCRRGGRRTSTRRTRAPRSAPAATGRRGSRSRCRGRAGCADRRRRAPSPRGCRRTARLTRLMTRVRVIWVRRKSL